jgi:hypothetical protein
MTTPTHRERYPEQYTHPLVGKLVRCKFAPELGAFTCERVMSTRFGLLVPLPRANDGPMCAAALADIEAVK